MSLLVIPTFNRSAKLQRILDWYARERPHARVVILDASNEPAHREANCLAVAAHSGFASRIDTVGQDSIPGRLLAYLEGIDEELVAIGNDEDAFLPEFLEAAFRRLIESPDYVVATGRYITTARPLLGVRRISYWTDSFLGLDVDDDDPAVRVINFQRLNACGVPPLYWSVRRRSAFLESCRLALRLRLSSAHELVDQVASCALGKISISAEPMLLRDESKVRYRGFKSRDAGRLYIDASDLDEIERIAAERWGREVAVAARSVTSWYRARQGGESYNSRWTSRVYCRFSPPPGTDDSRMLRVLRMIIRWSCTAGTLLSQFAAFLFFARYMFMTGHGPRFLRQTRSIPVHKVG